MCNLAKGTNEILVCLQFQMYNDLVLFSINL